MHLMVGNIWQNRLFLNPNGASFILKTMTLPTTAKCNLEKNLFLLVVLDSYQKNRAVVSYEFKIIIAIFVLTSDALIFMAFKISKILADTILYAL